MQRVERHRAGTQRRGAQLIDEDHEDVRRPPQRLACAARELAAGLRGVGAPAAASASEPPVVQPPLDECRRSLSLLVDRSVMPLAL